MFYNAGAICIVMSIQTNPPRLRQITLLRDRISDWNGYPFSVPVLRNLTEIVFESRVCFFVGENGSGKSTLLEAIAEHVGFNREGGGRNFSRETTDSVRSTSPLSRALRLSWSRKLTQGFFLRAESFFNMATYLDELQREDPRTLACYGRKSLHQQSHGQSFLALLENRFSRQGFYLLDEPEAALSPQSQLSFLLLLHNFLKGNTEIQFIIATHSPVILAFPDSQILSFDGERIAKISYEESAPYNIVHGFLNDPKNYLRHLFAELPLE
jgi:predicted ATPase